MTDLGERIAAWEAAGLIDRATAERLLVAEDLPIAMQAKRADTGAGTDDGTNSRASGGTRGGSPDQARDTAHLAVWFGPSVTIPEVFAYLGTAFLLSGWTTYVARSSFGVGTTEFSTGVGGLIAAVVLIAIGVVLRRGDERRARSAGVCFMVAVPYAGAGITSLAVSTGLDFPSAGLVGAAAALAVAIGLRRFHPAVLTQVGLIGSVTVLSAAFLSWGQSVVAPDRGYTGDGTPIASGPDPLVLALATAITWLACALVIGLIGLNEARAAERGDPAAARRAAISRFWAGVVAVVGLALAMTRSAPGPDGNYERVITPWVGQLAILIMCAILLERAFRRDSTAFVYAAALGLIIALSDFNFTYLSDTTEVGLLIEGAILLGAGFAADRLRRRIGRQDAGGAPPTVAAATLP